MSAAKWPRNCCVDVTDSLAESRTVQMEFDSRKSATTRKAKHGGTIGRPWPRANAAIQAEGEHPPGGRPAGQFACLEGDSRWPWPEPGGSPFRQGSAAARAS